MKLKQIIIFGCGISAATLANVLANKKWKVNIYEKQSFVGGNCFDSYNSHGLLIHDFGPHIFHTSNQCVYKFINKFTKLNNFINKVFVKVDNKIFPLPINFNSIKIIMGNEGLKTIRILKEAFPNIETISFFDLRKIKNKLVKKLVNYISRNVYFNYSSKMWGIPFKNINPNIINRVKIILSYKHNYFPDDTYQGLPNNGYTNMIKKMLSHPNIFINLKTDSSKVLKLENNKVYINKKQVDTPIVYCGSLDELFKYKYGVLPYRSLDIKFFTINKTSYQNTAVVNYPADPKMTRIAEYKKMTLQKISNITTISKEYPGQFDINSKKYNKRYYPINNEDNKKMYDKYLSELQKYKIYPLGRLAQYKYYDMDDAIYEALKLADKINNE